MKQLKKDISKMNNLYKDIFTRQSCRRYSLEKLNQNLLDNINDKLDDLNTIHNTNLNINLVEKYDINSMLDGYIGNIGKIDAPYYLILSNEETKKGYIDTGYSGELVLLYLKSLGLGSCWIGANFSSEKIKKQFGISNKVLSLISFGKPNGNLDRDPSNAKRKDISDILINQEIQEKFQPIIETIRLAPSAINNQPWRVLIDKRDISLYLANPNVVKKIVLKNLNYIDMGIAIKQLEIALNYFEYDFEIVKKAQKELKDLSHILTFRLKE